MKVFLLRHTEAAYGGPDPERELTRNGHTVAKNLAKHMRGNPFFDFTEVWVSPYRRAIQTADPIHQDFKPTPTLQVMDELVPHGESLHLFQKLEKINKSVLLVGHNPLLADFGRTLMGMPAQNQFPFKKGAMLVLKRDSLRSSGYSLAAYLTPASLGIRA